MRKKKSWGPSNPLWRYLHSKRSRSSSTRKRKAKRKTYGGESMARRRRSRRSSYRRSNSGGGILGLFLPAAAGAVAASMNSKLPQMVPMQEIAVGGLGGYLLRRNMKGIIAGVAGAFIAPKILGGLGSGAQTQSSVVVYG